jgi:hypothetical protein
MQELKKIKSISEKNRTVELYSNIKKNDNDRYSEEYFVRTEVNGTTVETPKFASFSDAYDAFDVIVSRDKAN